MESNDPQLCLALTWTVSKLNSFPIELKPQWLETKLPSLLILEPAGTMNYSAIKPEQTAVKWISDHLKSSLPPLLAAQTQRGRETFWLLLPFSEKQLWHKDRSGHYLSSQGALAVLPNLLRQDNPWSCWWCHCSIQVQERLASAEVGYRAKQNNPDFPTSIKITV